ncbi:MAG: hypothetical protein ACLTOM_12840 [Roseburia sp.]
MPNVPKQRIVCKREKAGIEAEKYHYHNQFRKNTAQENPANRKPPLKIQTTNRTDKLRGSSPRPLRYLKTGLKLV